MATIPPKSTPTGEGDQPVSNPVHNANITDSMTPCDQLATGNIEDSITRPEATTNNMHLTNPATDTLDDDVQFVELRDLHDTIRNPQTVIDLTEDDDENEAHARMYDRGHQTEPVQLIKTEADDSSDLLMQNLHELPELGSTVVPDETAGQSDVGLASSNNEFQSADMMAAMLSAFNQNAGTEPLLEATEVKNLPPFEEVDSEEEDIQARVRFQKLEDDYQLRQTRGGVSMEERIAFERAANMEKDRRIMRRNRKQHEKDWNEAAQVQQSLFIPEENRTSTVRASDDDSSGYAYVSAIRSPTPNCDSDIETSEQPTGGRAKGKGSKATAKRAVKPAPKKAAKASVSKRQPRSRTSGGRRGKKSKASVFNTTSLFQNNIIAEAINNQGQQPSVFAAKRKKDALAQLISSIPEGERNLHAGDKASLNNASKNFNGKRAIRPTDDGHWKMRGMKTSLKNYQYLGVSWMRGRENQLRHPRGGILGDDMGLGKTVSALANMVDGRPTSTHIGAKATLIVVPPSLTNQWMEEIERHIEHPGRVVNYSSSMKVLEPVKFFAEQDIVITSYHEVVRSLPKNDPPPQIFTARAKEEWWLNEIAEKKGPLHQINWHRIILDEAQAIKNHKSKTSEAVCYLKGRFRWCLSGTPIQNGLEEFYPYFKFLRCANTGNYELFKHNFAKRGSDKALQRLQVFLGRIMLRRTHQDKLFGKPVLVLPPIKPVETIEVRFNAVERAIYHIVQQRFTLKIKTLGNNADKNFHVMFVLLLRLRQLVGHPLLIQKTLKDFLEVEDLEKLWKLTEGERAQLRSNEAVDDDDGRDTAAALRIALSTSQNRRPMNPAGSVSGNASDNKLSSKFRKYLQALHDDGSWARANERSLCVACGSPPTTPYITSCMHLYCLACLNTLHHSEYMERKGEAACLSCGLPIKTSEAFAAKAFGEAGDVQKTLTGGTRQTPEEEIDWYNVGGPMLRSAKIKGAVAKIKEWFEQDPANKILVFTQFRGMIKVMERVCREEVDWGYASYHGAMSFELRDEQVKRFRNDADCRIMLAAMKAGGVGLNLTMANRVIILDLWWNVSVESQAFTRCFRIGQLRDVEVVRFVVRDSIDTDILAMQARKIAEIEQAMEHHRSRHLTVQELLELFGESGKGVEKEGADADAGEVEEEEEEEQLQHGQDNRQQDTQVVDDDEDRFIFADDPYDPVEQMDKDDDDDDDDNNNDDDVIMMDVD